MKKNYTRSFWYHVCLFIGAIMALNVNALTDSEIYGEFLRNILIESEQDILRQK